MQDLMTTADPKEFRYGVPEELYERWLELHNRTGIPQRQILHRLVTFLLEQNELTQSMVLGAVSPTPELLELAIKRATKQSPIGVIGGRSTTARESFERGNSPKESLGRVRQTKQ